MKKLVYVAHPYGGAEKMRKMYKPLLARYTMARMHLSLLTLR